MNELGELNEGADKLEKAGLRVVAISTDPLADAKKTAAAFPKIKVVSDADASLGRALAIMDPGALRAVEHEVYGPTQILVDGAGKIEELWRGVNVAERRSLDQILAAAAK